MLRIHLPFDDVTYNIDQTLELTVMSLVCRLVILYAKYLAKTLCMVRRRNKKCSEIGPKRCCVPVPVPVLSLIVAPVSLVLLASAIVNTQLL